MFQTIDAFFGGISKKKPNGSVLSTMIAVDVPNLEFVVGSLPDAGNKNFPNAGGTQRSHGMKTPIPTVEIANHTDALGIGRPDGKTCAWHPVNDTQLRSQLFVNDDVRRPCQRGTGPLRPV